MITLIGILVGLLVFVLFSPVRIRRGEASQRPAEMYSLDTARTLSEQELLRAKQELALDKCLRRLSKYEVL